MSQFILQFCLDSSSGFVWIHHSNANSNSDHSFSEAQKTKMMDFLLLSFFLHLILYLVAGPRPFKIPIHNCDVCITGGSSDIGLAIAHRIASEGTLISFLPRSFKKLQEAQDSIRQATSGNAQIFSANLRIYDSLYKAVAKARPINVLVVNQGIFVPRELKREARSEIESQGERQLNEGQRTEDEGS